MADDLADRVYPLLCPECEHVSHKSLLELIHSAKLPCDGCRLPINLASEYGQARLEEILVSLGREPFIIPDTKKLD